MSNPLAKYFRAPGMHVMLPSRGAFSDPGDIDFAVNGELAVLPMGASDEILAKNPDGLLNGHSVERIIESCVPGIKRARNLPAQDIDMLLLAIRFCSNGDEMALNARCPQCKGTTEFAASISGIMATCRHMESEYSVRVSDELVVHLRPYDFEATTKMALAAFEETKLFQSFLDVQMDSEARTLMFANSFEKISQLNLDLLSRCVRAVVIPQQRVTDPEFIRDFVLNSDKRVIHLIQERLQEIKQTGVDKQLTVTCENKECTHTWTTDLQFDPSHFFA